jgi:arylsulfatase
MPEKLAQLKELFLVELTRNLGLPTGGGLWVPVYHPELRATPPYTSWTFPGAITRMPEFAAPALGNKDNIIEVDVDVPENPSGVIYALGAFSGGLSLYVKDGVLSYEYNLFEIAGRISRPRTSCRPARQRSRSKRPTSNRGLPVRSRSC